MKLSIEIAGTRYQAQSTQAVSLGIALDFSGAQLSCFGVAPAQIQDFRAGSFIGNVRLGGSCNVREFTLNPHCHGTHTETIAHITTASVAPAEVVPVLCPATLISLTPALARDCGETYIPQFGEHDRAITAAQLRNALSRCGDEKLQALVLRTLPNSEAKTTQAWQLAPFFTIEAMNYLVQRKVQHLLVDFPSADRIDDGGHLSAHHHYWNVAEGGHDASTDSRSDATISELIFVPNSLADGLYLLNLQVPSLLLDAVPSRPVLIPLESC